MRRPGLVPRLGPVPRLPPQGRRGRAQAPLPPLRPRPAAAPAGTGAICDRPAGPARIISCGNCGQQGRDAGHGWCNRCKLADPDWPFRYSASLAKRLRVIPPWWQALTGFAAARHHPGGAVTILRHAGRVISADPAAGPRQSLATATRADGALDGPGRALTGLLTSQGLILPGDDVTREARLAQLIVEPTTTGWVSMPSTWS
jgi:hypothetical protein